MEVDPDTINGTVVGGDAAHLVRRNIFFDYEATEAVRLERAKSSPPVDVEIDRRLSSWGYT